MNALALQILMCISCVAIGLGIGVQIHVPKPEVEAPPGWSCSKNLAPWGDRIGVYTLTDPNGRHWTMAADGHGMAVLEKP